MAGTDAARVAYRRRLGATLAAFRGAVGASQEAVATFLGVNVETLGRWERGEREPKAYELHRLVAHYGADPEWLLDPTDSVTELDARTALLRRAAVEAARADVEAEIAQRAAAGTSARRGKSRA